MYQILAGPIVAAFDTPEDIRAFGGIMRWVWIGIIAFAVFAVIRAAVYSGVKRRDRERQREEDRRGR